MNILLTEKCDKLEKEIFELKEKISISTEFHLKHQNDTEFNKAEYLEKKFSVSKYDEKYIIKCLQKDLLDFQEYTKDQIRRNKALQEELIRLVQEAVGEISTDFEVKLYGSHATSLCLPWSDLDIVLVHKRTNTSNNYGVLQSVYLNLLVILY